MCACVCVCVCVCALILRGIILPYLLFTKPFCAFVWTRICSDTGHHITVIGGKKRTMVFLTVRHIVLIHKDDIHGRHIQVHTHTCAPLQRNRGYVPKLSLYTSLNPSNCNPCFSSSHIVTHTSTHTHMCTHTHAHFFVELLPLARDSCVSWDLGGLCSWNADMTE